MGEIKSTCDVCNGEGKKTTYYTIEPSETLHSCIITCYRCKGSGIMTTYYDETICQRCNGKGGKWKPYWNNDLPDSYWSECSHCEGTGKNKDSGCFITSAIVISLDKDDNCRELQVLRHYRDNWLVNQVFGYEVIQDYYKIAPEIVNKIEFLQKEKSKIIYQNLYKNYIEKIILLIENQQYWKAGELYCEMVLELASKYLNVKA